MSNADVTIKVTQSTLSFLNLILKFQNYLKKEFKKKLLSEKLLKLHLSIKFTTYLILNLYLLFEVVLVVVAIFFMKNKCN